MKTRISIAIAKNVLAEVDYLAGCKRFRSSVIGRILREYFQDSANSALRRGDLELLNDAAERLNREAAEVLTYQVSRDSL
jgi:metal-responsive CopG/Arc/MetJ family transcriptional regulator